MGRGGAGRGGAALFRRASLQGGGQPKPGRHGRAPGNGRCTVVCKQHGRKVGGGEGGARLTATAPPCSGVRGSANSGRAPSGRRSAQPAAGARAAPRNTSSAPGPGAAAGLACPPPPPLGPAACCAMVAPMVTPPTPGGSTTAKWGPTGSAASAATGSGWLHSALCVSRLYRVRWVSLPATCGRPRNDSGQRGGRSLLLSRLRAAEALPHLEHPRWRRQHQWEACASSLNSPVPRLASNRGPTSSRPRSQEKRRQSHRAKGGECSPGRGSPSGRPGGAPAPPQAPRPAAAARPAGRCAAHARASPCLRDTGQAQQVGGRKRELCGPDQRQGHGVDWEGARCRLGPAHLYRESLSNRSACPRSLLWQLPAAWHLFDTSRMQIYETI